MKRFCFLATTLILSAVSAFGECALYMDNFGVDRGDIGKTITLPVKATFSGRLNGWDLEITYPEHLVPTYCEPGADMTLSYYNARGRVSTFEAPLYGANEPWDHLLSTIGQQGYYQDSSGNWVSYGVVKWEGGEYEEMLLLSFIVEEGFEGGDIIFYTTCAAGSDSRGGTILDNGDHKRKFTRTCHVVTAGVILDKHMARILPGQQMTLNATCFPLEYDLTVTSSDPNVAQATMVGNTIQVTGISEGTATITVSPTDSTAHSDVCVVTVDGTVTLDEHTARILPGEQITLNATTCSPEEQELAASSSNPEVAQASIVDGRVQVTGVSEGTATITVQTANGIGTPDSCVVTVYTKLGDVDRDGKLNIADVVAMIDMIMGYNTTYSAENADVDCDGIVNIADVVALIDCILNNEWPKYPIEKIIPREYLDIFEQHMPIYYGNTPPIIEGVYLMSPTILVYSTHGGYDMSFVDYYYKFFNQATIGNTVDFEYISKITSSGGHYYGKQYESTIQGSGNNFTVFFKVTGTGDGIDYEEVQLYSGTIDENGVHNLYNGFVLLDKSDDPYPYLVPVGTIRVFKDGDGWSEATTWPGINMLKAMKPAGECSLKSDHSMP